MRFLAFVKKIKTRNFAFLYASRTHLFLRTHDAYTYLTRFNTTSDDANISVKTASAASLASCSVSNPDF